MARGRICLLVFLLFNVKYKWTCLAATNFCHQPLGMERRIIGDAQITASSTYNAVTHTGKEARLHNSRSWCSATSSQTNQWVKVDLEKPLQITGIAIQGDPKFLPNFIRKFKLRYSTDGGNYTFTHDNFQYAKEYIGANTTNELKTVSFETKPFSARYVEFRPTERNPASHDVCVRFELYGCSYVCSGGLGIEAGLSLPSGFILSASSSKSGNEAFQGRLSDPSCWCASTNAANEYLQIDFDFIAEVGAENRVLEDSRFTAYATTQWVSGRYFPKDGRLNSDRPWGSSKNNQASFWFKVDLGRVMLVNAIATQGDPTHGPNFFPDYKVEYGLESTGVTVVTVKNEGSTAAKIFPGNTNNMGVKFNFLKDNPISTRFVKFLKNTEVQNDYTLRVELYASPQVCSTSFGMVAGEISPYEPAISVSSGILPFSRAKINSKAAWCVGGSGSGHYFMYDLGKNKQISGIAIQGNPSANKWVKT